MIQKIFIVPGIVMNCYSVRFDTRLLPHYFPDGAVFSQWTKTQYFPHWSMLHNPQGPYKLSRQLLLTFIVDNSSLPVCSNFTACITSEKQYIWIHVKRTSRFGTQAELPLSFWLLFSFFPDDTPLIHISSFIWESQCPVWFLCVTPLQLPVCSSHHAVSLGSLSLLG